MSGTRLRDLVEEQNKLWNRMQEIQRVSEDENRDWTAEERENWDKANERIDVVSGDIERLERAAKLAAKDNDVEERKTDGVERVDTPEAREQAHAEAFGAFVRDGMSGLTTEQRHLMIEHRASPQGTAPAADGGYLVPTGYRTVMTEALKAYGGLINHANIINTTTGNQLNWPSNDDTSNTGEIISENPASHTELGVSFGTKSVGAYTYTSKLVRVSLQLLQDSAFDIDTWLPRKLGERIGRAVAAHLVNGTGTTMPYGILPTATVGKKGAASSGVFGVSYDDIIDLEHSIDPAYRQLGNTRFIFNDSTLAALRKLKDTQNRPLWLPVPVAGMPATINGQSYTIDQAMPSLGATDKKALLFGDFRVGYLVRQALDVRMVRLSERYAELLQIGYFGFMRLDAVPDDANAVKAFETADT